MLNTMAVMDTGLRVPRGEVVAEELGIATREEVPQVILVRQEELPEGEREAMVDTFRVQARTVHHQVEGEGVGMIILTEEMGRTARLS
jgi:hypothetical protein